MSLLDASWFSSCWCPFLSHVYIFLFSSSSSSSLSSSLTSLFFSFIFSWCVVWEIESRASTTLNKHPSILLRALRVYSEGKVRETWWREWMDGSRALKSACPSDRATLSFMNNHPSALEWGPVRVGLTWFIWNCSLLPPPTLSLYRSLFLSTERKPSLRFPATSLRKTTLVLPWGKTHLASPVSPLTYMYLVMSRLLIKKLPASTLIAISLNRHASAAPRDMEWRGCHEKWMGIDIFA